MSLGLDVDLIKPKEKSIENLAPNTRTTRQLASSSILGVVRVGALEGDLRPHGLLGFGIHFTSIRLDSSPKAGSTWADTGTTERRTLMDADGRALSIKIQTGADYAVTDNFLAGWFLAYNIMGGASYNVTDAGRSLGLSRGSGALTAITFGISLTGRFWRGSTCYPSGKDNPPSRSVEVRVLGGSPRLLRRLDGRDTLLPMLLLAAIAGGFMILAYCGDRLVESASALAERAGVTPAVVGLTVVAAGTSAPELFVSVLAVLSGSPDIAAGNVVGSNIANVTLILGLTALISPVPIAGTVIRLDYPFMALASWVMLILCRDRVFDRAEAGFFVAALAAFIAYAVTAARRAPKAEARELGELVPDPAASMSRRPYPLLLGALALSIAGLSVGAKLLVYGATGFALRLGISERVIGLTMVAIGTSIPELVASIQAARKGHHEMALANLIGSNIFNVLGILGVAGLVRPVPISAAIAGFDLRVMMVSAMALAPLVYWRGRVSRLSGALLVGFYLVYLAQVGAG